MKTIVHLSDLHFPNSLSWLSLRGKMFSGYLNYYLNRRKQYPIEIFHKILEFVKTIDYDILILSGDLTNVSHPREFEKSFHLLKPILDQRLFLVPGNHDRYIESSLEPVDLFEKQFHSYMGKKFGQDRMSSIRVQTISNQTIIGWDSNQPTPFMEATGFVHSQAIHETEKYLDENHILEYILVCHHPIRKPPDIIEQEHHKLKNKDEILQFLNRRPPLIYFHGHHHTNWIIQPSQECPFFVCNSASSSRVIGTKYNSGFHVIQIEMNQCNFERFVYDENLKKIVSSKLLLY